MKENGLGLTFGWSGPPWFSDSSDICDEEEQNSDKKNLTFILYNKDKFVIKYFYKILHM